MTLTPEQFNKLVTRDEFREEIGKIREEMMTKDDKHEILNAIDGLTKLVKF